MALLEKSTNLQVSKPEKTKAPATEAAAPATPAVDKKKFNDFVGRAQEHDKKGNLKKALELYLEAQALKGDHEKLNKKIKTLIERVRMIQECKPVPGFEEFQSHKDQTWLDPGQSQSFSLPSSMFNKLMPHQRVSIGWMWKLFKTRMGGVLGDDMGLGKTVQLSSFIYGLFRSANINNVLIVVPLAVMDNWTRELETWAPKIRVVRYHGTAAQRRDALAKAYSRGGVVMTTYETAAKNVEQLSSHKDEGTGEDVQIDWDLMVLDEGHKIKNPSTKTAKAVTSIPARTRLVLTGTPLMNNLKEVWALFDFACKSQVLGDYKAFKTEFETPITNGQLRTATEVERQVAQHLTEEFRSSIAPYFLRREKSEIFPQVTSPVAKLAVGSPLASAAAPKEIPKSPNVKQLTITAKKNDFIVWVHLSPLQVKLYTTFLDAEQELIQKVIAKAQSALPIIQILRKICDHPGLLNHELQYTDSLDLANSLKQGSDTEQSGKLQFLMDLLANLKAEGHRVLIFSQSRKMLDRIQTLVTERKYAFQRIDGTMSKISDRQVRIDAFNNDPSFFCFLLTTTVGGVGLNLTGADRVVIFDPAWNTVDDQAADRVYRIGQQKNVIIYRLITCGTIEEKMYRKQVFKGALSRTVTGKKVKQYNYFTKGELGELFQFQPNDHLTSETQKLLADMHGEAKVGKRQSLESHTARLEQMGIFGLSQHDLLYSNPLKSPEKIDDVVVMASSAKKRLKDTVLPVNVVEYERNQKREETIAAVKESARKTKEVRLGKVMLLDDREDLADQFARLSLQGNKPAAAAASSSSSRSKPKEVINLDTPTSTGASDRSFAVSPTTQAPVVALIDKFEELSISNAGTSSDPVAIDATPQKAASSETPSKPIASPTPAAASPVEATPSKPVASPAPVAAFSPVQTYDTPSKPVVAEVETIPGESTPTKANAVAQASLPASPSTASPQVSSTSSPTTHEEVTPGKRSDVEEESSAANSPVNSPSKIVDVAAEDDFVVADDEEEEISSGANRRKSGFFEDEAEEDWSGEETGEASEEDEGDECRSDDVTDDEEYEDAEAEETIASPAKTMQNLPGLAIETTDLYDPEDGYEAPDATTVASVDEEEVSVAKGSEEDQETDIERVAFNESDLLLQQLQGLSISEKEVVQSPPQPAPLKEPKAASPAPPPTKPKVSSVVVVGDVDLSELEEAPQPVKQLKRLRRPKNRIVESDEEDDYSDELEVRAKGQAQVVIPAEKAKSCVDLAEEAVLAPVMPKKTPAQPASPAKTSTAAKTSAKPRTEAEEEEEELLRPVLPRKVHATKPTSPVKASTASIGTSGATKAAPRPAPIVLDESSDEELESEAADDDSVLFEVTSPEAKPAAKKPFSVVDVPFRSGPNFERNREVLARKAFAEINQRVFGGKLPTIALRWRKTTKIAGLFCNDPKLPRITLSRNYLTTLPLLLSTLAHEMAHAAVHFIDQNRERAHHGPVWQKWARIAMAAYKGQIKITVFCDPDAQEDEN